MLLMALDALRLYTVWTVSQLEMLVVCILLTSEIEHRYQVSKAHVLCTIFKNGDNLEKVKHMENRLTWELGALVVLALLRWDGFLAGLPFGVLTFGYTATFAIAMVFVRGENLLSTELVVLLAIAAPQLIYVLAYFNVACVQLTQYVIFGAVALLFVWDLVLLASAISGTTSSLPL